MNRRDALSRVALLLGGSVIGAEFFLSGCGTGDKKIGQSVDFTADDIAYLDEVAETIIPATDTPGAKAAKVGTFMTVMVKDCYDEKNQKVFLEGMNKLNEASKKKFGGSGFMKITPEQRKELLTEIDKEQKEYGKNKKKEDDVHYFTQMKQLTLLGYFTSEPGATQALRYVPVPGKFEACIPYKKGDKAWAL
ncbi:gluconate 2-dehydrogenase subunit 3 family protein [Niastella caeni]|uniref:Gluconate 2-dehydrogenase subunit 3 family protein n=1 Tax=Niastella caeni TaxID=2569763 RepID=A0A4S8HPU5_9BACT|nr:gluconate 2-dehydrogenase subunit 3 family protein [Niastella caeni]THU36831.1 gluconate 2-dehydrogenase subunit 3 family protein [Niastella caeni]